jgi:hypothetical protein
MVHRPFARGEEISVELHTSGWGARRRGVEGGAFTASFSVRSAGVPRWHLFWLTVHTVFGVACGEPQGATRWRI